MINLPVLVLNQSFEPLNICRVRRAIVLIYQNKAEMVENGMGVIRTVGGDFPVPTVIRLSSIVRRPPRTVRRLTRLEIFKRDHYTCQYCGKETSHLTLDHVMPRYRHGAHTWENIVSACVPCNRRKAGRTPQEANMKLKHEPVKPRVSGLFYIPAYYSNIRKEWQKYLPSAS
ncbi:MAG: HNH endonuclease [Chloroflexi bacterium]|nr:HNH endonuclease [Chloroflexota bacterium]